MRFYIEKWTRLIEQKLGSKIEIRGPAPAPVEKIRDEYRFQLWYFMPAVGSVIDHLRELRESFKLDKDVIDLGLRPGPSFSNILKHCYDAQLEGKFEDIESALAYLKSSLSDKARNPGSNIAQGSS